MDGKPPTPICGENGPVKCAIVKVIWKPIHNQTKGQVVFESPSELEMGQELARIATITGSLEMYPYTNDKEVTR